MTVKPAVVSENSDFNATRMIILLAIAAFTSAAGMRMCDAMLPELERYFSPITNSALVISGFATAYGLMQFAFGPLGEKYGKLKVIGIATLLCVVGNTICIVAPNFTTLVIGRIFAGATAAAIIPLSMAWIGDNIPYEQRQAILARFLTGQIFGMVMGQFLGGFLSDTIHWRAAFVVLALCYGSVGAILLYRTRSHHKAGVSQHQTPAHQQVLQILQKPWARFILSIVFIEGFLFHGSYPFLPKHIHETIGLSLTQAGLIATGLGLGGLIFSMTVKHLLRHLGEKGLASVGGILMSLSFFTLAFSLHVPLLIIACIVIGLGFYMLHNTLQINATQMEPLYRGTAVSLFACMFFLGQATGSLFAGTFIPVVGFRWYMSGISFGILLISLITFHHLRQRSLH